MGMDELVKRLSKGNHPIALRREKSAEELKQSIDRNHVLITFTDTKGGTEIGVTLDGDGIDLNEADFTEAKGSVHLEGNLTLNYVATRCIADIDLSTLTGQGHLKPLESV